MLEFIGYTLALIAFWIVFAALIRKWGSHTLINGFMSKEKADAVFPEWRPKQKTEDS